MWYDIIDTFLLTFGFKKSVANTNLYILKQDNQLMILALYVDDAIIVNIDVDGLFKSKLAKEFAMTNLGHIQYCLRIQIRKIHCFAPFICTKQSTLKQNYKCLSWK
jgi:hypothetical protein